jgi:hypothetical protein
MNPTPDPTLPLSEVQKAVLALYDESFTDHDGTYLDKGTSLFTTLDTLDAAAASHAASPHSGSIAAHAEHISFYLEVVERYMQGERVKHDWAEIWNRVRVVDEAQWTSIRALLAATHARIRETLADPARWGSGVDLTGAMAIIAHTAFHLGAIRQIVASAKR